MEPNMLGQVSRSWEVIGYESASEIFQALIPVGCITIRQLHVLLQVLVAKHGLTDDEIVGCFLKRNTKGYQHHLEITSENIDAERRTNYYCGSNPHFVARLRVDQ